MRFQLLTEQRWLLSRRICGAHEEQLEADAHSSAAGRLQRQNGGGEVKNGPKEADCRGENKTQVSLLKHTNSTKVDDSFNQASTPYGPGRMDFLFFLILVGGGGTESRLAELGQIRFHDFCARKNPPSCPAGRTGLASRNVFFMLHVQPAGINFIVRKSLPEMRSRGDVGGR